MRRRQTNILIASGVALAGQLPGPVYGQIPEGWEVREIVAAGTEFDYSPPDINDRGQVVFHRWRPGQQPTLEILLYDRGHTIELTDDEQYDGFPRINNLGQVVWTRDVDPDASGLRGVIVRWTDGLIEEVSDPPANVVDQSPDINDAGQIVWDRTALTPPNRAQVYMRDDDEAVPITQDTFANQVHRINQRGDVLFTRYDFSVAPWHSEVVLRTGGRLLTLAGESRQLLATALNDLPTVAWRSTFDGTEVWQAGEVTTLVPDGSATSVNNAHEFAVSRGSALWLFRGQEQLRLTDGSVGAGAGQINERGEIVFLTGSFPGLGISVYSRRAFVADLDSDGDVDLHDFGLLQRCTDAEITTYGAICSRTDSNGDGMVDVRDYPPIYEFLEGPLAD